MMRRLVPLFILEQAGANRLSGSFDAIAVNIDLIGFTAITQEFMQHSHVGVEALTDIINLIFTPAISALESRGGFVSGFAGDALTALFAGGEWQQALAAALEIRDHAAAREWHKTEYGELQFAVRIGIGSGMATWDIFPHPAQSVYWFQGPAITAAANAQQLARPNEVLAYLEEGALPDAGFIRREQVDGMLHRIVSQIRPLAPPNPHIPWADPGSFIPEALSQPRAEGEFRDVLSCFANLRADDPETRHRVLESVIARGGYISHIDCTDKGWVVYAMFGAPRCYDRYQFSALNCALEMLAACGENIRIGMSAGLAYAGFVGSASRGEYTGMGIAVNLAARMMMAAGWGEVWYDSAIHKAVGNAFGSESMGRREFKGCPHPQEARRLLAKLPEWEFSGFTNRMVGSDGELRTLLSHCRDPLSGARGAICYLYGAAGQGKSRLLYELKQALGDQARYIYLQPDSIHGTALGPFVAWIRNEYTKGLAGSPARRVAEFRKNWAEFAGQFGSLPDSAEVLAELQRIESVIAALIGLEWEDSVYSRLDPKSRASVSGTALKSLLELMGRLKPVVLAVEDLHWLDQESKDLLVLLSRGSSPTPLKIIISARPMDDGSLPVIGHSVAADAQSVLLDGLNEPAVEALLADSLSQPAGKALLEYVQARAQGNPFIVAQLSIYLLETGRLELVDGAFALKEACPDIPESVQAILVARIDRLEAELKRVVHTASVLGTEFANAILSASLKNLGHVYYDKGEMDRAREYYELALSIWTEVFGARHPEVATSLNCIGDIHSQSGQFDKALSNYQTALSIRRDFLGNRHTHTADSLNNLGIVYDLTGEYDAARRHFEQALEIKLDALGEMHIEVASVLNNLGGVYDHAGDYAKALEIHTRALNIWRTVLGERFPETATCLNNIGCAYENQGAYDHALEYYERALDVFREVKGERSVEASIALVNIGCIHEANKDYEAAIGFYGNALDIRGELLGADHPATKRTRDNLARLRELVAGPA